MKEVELKWTELPSLPPASGQRKSLGLAGILAGVHNDALIAAGGSNFPDAPPWGGGQKVWWDDNFVMQKNVDSQYRWLTDKSFKLPQPSVYGVSISTKEGVICIGSCDADKCHNDVFLLQWDPSTRTISTERLRNGLFWKSNFVLRRFTMAIIRRTRACA